MNRKDFFKKLGLSVMGVVLAPKMILDLKEQKSQINPQEYHLNHCKQIYQIYSDDINKYYTPENILKVYRQTGHLIYEENAYTLRLIKENIP